jgi:type III secretory pathway component EscR
MKKYIDLKKICLISCLYILIGHNILAQAVDRKEQLESQKVAFITKQLSLTIEEAQRFWPVYNEFQQKKEEINRNKRQLLKKLVDENNGLADDKLSELSDTYIKSQLNEAKLISEYHEKFKTVLPIKKVIAYYKAEEKFKRFLLQEVRKRKKVNR